MSNSSSSSSSSGGVGLVGLVSGIWAYAATPSFVGLKGAFAAAMVGTGTSLACGLFALGGGLTAAAAGGLVGSAAGKGKETAVVFGLVGALGSGVVGIGMGYSTAIDIATEGTNEKQTQSVVQSERSEFLEQHYEKLDDTTYVIPAKTSLEATMK